LLDPDRILTPMGDPSFVCRVLPFVSWHDKVTSKKSRIAREPKKVLEAANSLLYCPQGKNFALFKARIPMINKIQSAALQRTAKWLVFAEFQGVK